MVVTARLGLGGEVLVYEVSSPRFLDPQSGGEAHRMAGKDAVSEVQFPVLADEVLAETVVLFFLHEPEAFCLVYAPGGDEHVVGPEGQLLVAVAPGEARAFFDQALAQA